MRFAKTPLRALRPERRAVRLLLLAGFFSVALAPEAVARTSCSYVGAPQNRLTVTVSRSGLAEIRRNGSEISVGEFLEPPVPCSGGIPTVLNTDLITARISDDSFIDVRLDGGPFAPGATAESEGAPEIEIEIRGRFALGTIIGTRSADEFLWGPGGAHAGLNLNAATAGDEDVDVTAKGPGAFLVAEGRAGNDTIIPAPGARVPDSVTAEGGKGRDRLVAPKHTESDLDGGAGRDVIRGGAASDVLSGGPGNDDIAAAGGADAINGGRGHDSLSAGRGRDLIQSRDGTRDHVNCGASRDRADADRRDRLRACELIARP